MLLNKSSRYSDAEAVSAVASAGITATNGGAGNAGKPFVADENGAIAGRVLETDGARLDGMTTTNAALATSGNIAIARATVGPVAWIVPDGACVFDPAFFTGFGTRADDCSVLVTVYNAGAETLTFQSFGKQFGTAPTGAATFDVVFKRVNSEYHVTYGQEAA